MALRDDIEALQRRCLSDFDAMDDFVQDTKTVWRAIGELGKNPTVQQDEQLIKIVDQETGKGKSFSEAFKLYEQKYEKNYIFALTFQHMVTLFETYFFDFLRLILLADPHHRLSKMRKVDVELILSVSDYPSLLELVVEKELDELKYRKVSDWFAFLNKYIHLDCPTEAEIGQIAEVKACRDILVHNSGMVNRVYLDKAGKYARYKEGERLEIDIKFHQETFVVLRRILSDLFTKTHAKM